MPNYATIPEFGQLTEYITQGQLVDGIYGIVIHPVPLEAQPILEPISVQAINIDYAKVNSINPIRVPDVTPEGLTVVKTTLGTNYYADVVRYTTDASANPLAITTKLVEVAQRPSWKVGLAVVINDIYLYPVDKNLYQCVQAHTTQSDWTPPVCKALWKRFYEPTDAPWPWVQPIGSVDAYPIGAKVTYGGYTWQNTIAANVCQPGVTGWTNLTPPVTPNWSYPVAYKIGDIVIYVPNGFTYKCIQAHTSQAGWTPPAVPALWQKQ
jgi:hypothetical protein